MSVGLTAQNTTGQYQIRCYLYKNGVVVGAGSYQTPSAANSYGNVSYHATVDANGTDYFQIIGYSNIASTTVIAGTAWFSAFPLSGVKGPPGDPGVGLLQTVSFQTGAVATGTTIFPLDNTIPQITEGTEFMTLAITPRSATSKLIINVVWMGTNNAANTLITALFQDSTASALAVAMENMNNPTGGVTLSFRHVMTSGTTSATTFKVRAGGSGAGTTTFNGTNSAGVFGGVMASSIVIQEVQ